MFETIDEMQVVLDGCMEGYTRRRPHQGRGTNGRTSVTAFVEGLPNSQPGKKEKRTAKQPTKHAA